MVNKFLKIFSFVFLTYSTASFAIECPQSIICKQAGDPTSCQLVGSDTTYWSTDSKKWFIPSPVAAGTYSLSEVESGYLSDSIWNNSNCAFKYSTAEGKYEKTIIINPTIGGYFEAAFDKKPNGWSISDTWAKCQPTPNLSCPLVEKTNMLMVDLNQYPWPNNAYSNVEVQFIIDGSSLSYEDNISNMSTAINPAIANKYCKSKEPHAACSLSVTVSYLQNGSKENNYAQIPVQFSMGTVTFDRTTLKITKIIQTTEKEAFAALGDFKIKQYTPFNSVGFEVSTPAISTK